MSYEQDREDSAVYYDCEPEPHDDAEPVEPLDDLLRRCFAVYQAQPLAVATPVVLVGQRIVDKGF